MSKKSPQSKRWMLGGLKQLKTQDSIRDTGARLSFIINAPLVMRVGSIHHEDSTLVSMCEAG